MPRGGYRENAGRKQGAPNKATAARQAKVAASGITPLEAMLDNMRVAHQRAKELEKLLSDLPPEELEARLQLMGEIARQRLASQNCAADAANYVHPKLAAISHATFTADGGTVRVYDLKGSLLGTQLVRPGDDVMTVAKRLLRKGAAPSFYAPIRYPPPSVH